ncbi:hypothetical protein [Streptomyces sp. NPDC127084]|uniref:hypothetical protein n=1 Tax=Streptomyces sp. NPDC127084 TaxID=3347133 RepID=UPI003667470A
MTTPRQYTGKRVDINRLTATTITDDDLDAIRSELHHYRATDTADDAEATDDTQA